MKAKQFGFTLIELMIVVVVIAILAALASASYDNSIRKSRRSDARVELNTTAQRLQRCFTTTNSYTPAAGRCSVVDELAESITSSEGFYTITGVLAATTFTLTAVPVAGKSQEKDDRCTSFSLTNSGKATALMSGTDNSDECW